MKKTKLFFAFSLSLSVLLSGCGTVQSEKSKLSHDTSAVSDSENETTSIFVSSTEVSEHSVSDFSESQTLFSELSTLADTSNDSSSDVPSDISVVSDEPEKDTTTEQFSTKYFVSRLSAKERSDFAVLYKSAADCEQQAIFPISIDEDELDRLMWLLNYDCPELIHLTGEYVPKYSDTFPDKITGVSFRYNMTKDEYERYRTVLDSYLEVLRDVTQGMNEYDKEMYVYREIFDNVVFDDYAAHAGSVYGALIEHRARCEGISKAFAWCMQGCGIECLTVAGTPLWENSSAYSSHSWNIINIDGDYYHVDIAADNLAVVESETTYPLYGFYNFDDKHISRTHLVSNIFDELGIPKCTTERLNYHILNDLYIDSSDDLQSRFYDILKTHYHDGKENIISIRFADEKDYSDFIDKYSVWLSEYIDNNALSDCNDTLLFNDVSITAVLVTENI